MLKRAAKKRRWEGLGWWERTSLDYFDGLLAFANADINDTDWDEALWWSMGGEKRVTVTTDDGPMVVEAADIHAVVEPGLEDQTEIKRWIPMIAGEPATLHRTRQLQEKVRRVLTRFVGVLDLIHRQRTGQGDYTWIERTKQRCKSSMPDVSTLPWTLTHFEEHHAILEMIKNEFMVPESRSATIYPTSGFVQFHDAGEDVARTLAWLLIGLSEVVFREERPVLRRCLFCETFFIHRTLKQRKFCSAPCRFNFHNKGLGVQGGGS